MYLCAPLCAHRGQKGVSESLEMVLQMVVRGLTGAGAEWQVLLTGEPSPLTPMFTFKR